MTTSQTARDVVLTVALSIAAFFSAFTFYSMAGNMSDLTKSNTALEKAVITLTGKLEQVIDANVRLAARQDRMDAYMLAVRRAVDEVRAKLHLPPTEIRTTGN